MPIVGEGRDVHIEYDIPEKYKEMITIDFLREFRNQLFKMHDYYSLEVFADQGIPINTSTTGWYAAFGKTCLLQKKEELLDYWHTLEWFDSDIFDGIVADMMVEKKLILDDAASVIANQLGMQPEEIEICRECYKYFPKELLTLCEETENEDPEYVCFHCKDIQESKKNNTLNYYQSVLEELEKRRKRK